MPWTSDHTKWLIDTGERLKTADGKEVEVREFRHEKDEAVLSAWARHFRNHYCLDAEIDFLRGRRSRSDYLTHIKFPSRESRLGPGIRAGDFGEILVADYLQWLLGFWVPRVRYKETYGAAASISDEYFDADELASADCQKIPRSAKSREVFPHPNGASLPRRKYAVIIDEAHSSQSGETATELKGVLGGAELIGKEQEAAKEEGGPGTGALHAPASPQHQPENRGDGREIPDPL